MRKFRKKKLTNAKGETFYQIFGPNPKTGKDEYKETVKGPGDVSKRADSRVIELTGAAFNLTEFGKRETRTVADLVAAFLSDCDDRERWTITNKAWYEKGRSLKPSTNRGYHAAAKDILPRLGDTLLITLELDDLNRTVKDIEDDVTKSVARRAGESLRTMLGWGADRGWTVQPMLLRLLSRLRLPPKCKREKIPTEAHIRAIFKVVFGKRPSKVTRIGYLYRRIIWLICITSGLRRMEIAQIRIENIDRDTGRVWIADSIDHATYLEMGTKTRSGNRYTWFPKQAMDAVDYLLEMRGNPTSGLLFEPRSGKTIGGGMYSTHLLPVLKEAGIPREESKGVINFHSTRHRSTSEHDRLGVTEVARAKLLGHSGGGDRGKALATTRGYTRALPEDMAAQRAVQKIADFYMPAEIEPIEEAMKLAKTAYHSWDPEKRRAYHRQYRKKYRAAGRHLMPRGHIADKSELSP
jgi:integrase